MSLILDIRLSEAGIELETFDSNPTALTTNLQGRPYFNEQRKILDRVYRYRSVASLKYVNAMAINRAKNIYSKE